MNSLPKYVLLNLFNKFIKYIHFKNNKLYETMKESIKYSPWIRIYLYNGKIHQYKYINVVSPFKWAFFLFK